MNRSLALLALASSLALSACNQGTPSTQAAGGAAPPADASRDAPPAAQPPAATAPTPAPSPSPNPADGAALQADYLGRWTGVEGMYLEVAEKPGGGVSLDMQWDLDNKGRFDGSVTAEGLRFMRNGVAETAVRSDGNATGLKYLAGKQDCLTVKSGEGYCRD